MRRRYSSPPGRVCIGFGWNGSGTPPARRSRNTIVQNTQLPSDTFLTPRESPPDRFTPIIIGHASRAVRPPPLRRLHDLLGPGPSDRRADSRSEEHTSELQSRVDLV